MEIKIIEIISEQLDVQKDKITLKSKFKDLGMDSLDEVEVAMALEEEYGIEIPDEEAEKMKTVKDVVDYIEKRMKK